MSPQVGYVLEHEVVPRLKAVIPRSVLCVGSEDYSELIADSTLLAARNMHNAEAKGKRITASNAAYYALQHCKSGRRAVGNSSSDAHGSTTQLTGRSRLESFDQIVSQDQEGSDECFMLHDVLGNSNEDVAMAVARKMDYEEFCAELSAREKAVVKYMVEGLCGAAIARKLRVTASTIQSIKKHLAKALVDFMGPQAQILQDVQRRPRWKDNLDATRERQAVRYARNHL
jgi:ATP/maltotriose-dependent transcriptional regulator MalT